MQEAHVHEQFATVDIHPNSMFVLMHEQARNSIEHSAFVAISEAWFKLRVEIGILLASWLVPLP